jgi:predicted ATPase
LLAKEHIEGWNMIENIYIKNFKSIIEDRIDLRNFTVLIGANGSGKSNLIKSLEFLGSIARNGLATSFGAHGGFSGIIPKAVPMRELKKSRILISYRKRLPHPWDSADDFPPVTVEHLLELAYSTKEVVRIVQEKIKFKEALAVADALKAGMEKREFNHKDTIHHSSFTLQRGEKGGIRYSTAPQISKETIPLYFEWLGFSFLADEVGSERHFRSIINQLKRGDRQPKRKRYCSFLDPGISTIVDSSPQARYFRDLIQSIRRYDLLLNELRADQKVSDSRQLTTAGQNMPSVLRYLASNPERENAMNRIMTTLGEISPHVETMRPKSLRTGKEFVEFVESAMGRGVESWESSDGTLRALAILLALETHHGNSTILIEEPEQNLHPWAVRSIIDHIRQVIEERSIQVIITTHSQQVLERVYPEEVLVATRTKSEGTKFKLLKDIVPEGKIEMGEAGELWVKGLLGGVPADD